MASTYSPSLRITLIGNGDQPGVWGSTTNTNLGTIIEDGIAGYETVSVVAAKQALTTVPGGFDQARNAMLELTTTTGADFEVYAPPVTKQYIIYNNSAYVATIYNSTVTGNTTAAGTGAAIAVGQTLVMVSDGTDCWLTDAGTGYVTLTGAEVLTNKTLTDVNLNGSYTEDVYAITGTTPVLNPANGTVQTWTLSANSTSTISASFVSGQSMTLMITKASYTLTLGGSIVWVGGTAPIYPTSGQGIVQLWKVSSTVYGVYVGAVA